MWCVLPAFSIIVGALAPHGATAARRAGSRCTRRGGSESGRPTQYSDALRPCRAVH